MLVALVEGHRSPLILVYGDEFKETLSNKLTKYHSTLPPMSIYKKFKKLKNKLEFARIHRARQKDLEISGHRFTFDTKICGLCSPVFQEIKTNLESYGPDQWKKILEYAFYLSKYVDLSQFLRWWHTTHARTSLRGMRHFSIYLFLNLNVIRNVINGRASPSTTIPFKVRRSKRVTQIQSNSCTTNENAVQKKIAEQRTKKIYVCFATVSVKLISKLNATHFGSPFLRRLYATIYLLILYACFSSLFFCFFFWSLPIDWRQTPQMHPNQL